jgi:hypothetical protein
MIIKQIAYEPSPPSKKEGTLVGVIEVQLG